MATDFNNKALMAKPVFVGSPTTNDLPLDVRTRIETIDEISQIEFPYIGMMIYVKDEDKFYVVKSLKGEEVVPGVAATLVQNRRVDQYEELNITSVAESGSGNNLIDEESAQKLLDLLESREDSGCDLINKESAEKLLDLLESREDSGCDLINKESAEKLLEMIEKEENGEYTCDCPFNFESAKKLLEILYDISSGGVDQSKVNELRDLLQIQFP